MKIFRKYKIVEYEEIQENKLFYNIYKKCTKTKTGLRLEEKTFQISQLFSLIKKCKM